MTRPVGMSLTVQGPALGRLPTYNTAATGSLSLTMTGSAYARNSSGPIGMPLDTTPLYCLVTPGISLNTTALYCLVTPGISLNTTALYCLVTPLSLLPLANIVQLRHTLDVRRQSGGVIRRSAAT